MDADKQTIVVEDTDVVAQPLVAPVASAEAYASAVVIEPEIAAGPVVVHEEIAVEPVSIIEPAGDIL